MTELRDKSAGTAERSLRAAARRIHVEAAMRSSGSTLVVVGVDRASQEPVVMRVLLVDPGTTGGAASRFLRAGQQAARIASPHVATVREVGSLEDDGPPYWIVEQATGTSLRELLALGRPVPLPITLEYAIETCRALQAAHACQLTHGMLRPSKIFRIPHADPVRIKVIDFGLAAATMAPTSRGASLPPQEPTGGAEYRSPELVAGSRRFEATSDMWGLGLVLFEMLAAQHPFPSSTTRADFARAVADGPPTLRSRGLAAPPQLEDLLRELLRKDASQRPATAAAVEERLLAIAAVAGVDMGGGKPPDSAGPARRAGAPHLARAGTDEEHVARSSTERGESPQRGAQPLVLATEPPANTTDASRARPRFLGPAMGNFGVRAGGYSLSGGSLPREEVAGRRRVRGAQSRRAAKRPSQAPHKRGSGKPPRESKVPAVNPTRTPQRSQPTQPDGLGGRPAILVRTDPATPRALGERQISALLGRNREEPHARRAGTPVPQDPPVSAPQAAAEAVAPPPPQQQEAPVFELQLEVDRPDPTSHTGNAASAPPSGAEHADPAPGESEQGSASTLPDRNTARPKLRTAPGSWTLDLSSGPGSWEIERTPSAPPVRGMAQDSSPPVGLERSGAPPGSTPPAGEAVPPGHAEAPSTPPIEQPFGPYRVERIVHVGPYTERAVAVATTGPLEGSRVVLERGCLGESVHLERCTQLAEWIAAAGHGNLLGVYEVGEVEQTPYLACEYVDGTDLRTVMRAAAARSEPLSPAMAAYLVRRIAAGLDAYHRATAGHTGVAPSAHGEVRPSNVLLSVTGEIKLGPPMLAHEPQTTGRGRLDFISPEELLGQPRDTSSEVFVLGVMLGELLIAEPIFPGQGVDVLLAIAQVEIEPLRRRANRLPAGMLAECERALARHPGDRHGSASELADALERFESDSSQCASKLGAMVRGVRDEAAVAPKSVRMREPERTALSTLATQTQAARRPATAPGAELVRVRRAHSGLIGQLPFSGLLEAIATGNLGPDDEVTWDASPFQPVHQVPTLAERLLLSAPTLKGNLVERRAADHVYQSREIPMLEVLTQMRLCHANALVLIENLSSESNRRTEVYLREGSVVGVRSSDPSELLGEQLVAMGALDRAHLSDACRALWAYEGKLGNALVGLGFIDAFELLRLIRERACARIAQVFAWHEARTRVYLGQGPPPSPFGLAMDLTEPMMAGVLVASEQEPATMMPGMLAQIEPGPRAPGTEGRELRDLPALLQATAAIVGSRPVVAQAIRALEARTGASERDACAALVVAQAMRWISVRAPGS